MAQEGSLTPEKQLLKLIEDPKSKSADIRAQVVKRHSLGLLSPGAWLSRFSFFKMKSSAWASGGTFHQADIRHINGILTLSVFALAFYFVTVVVMSFIELNKTPHLAFETPAGKETVPFSKTSLLKAASFYLEQARERDIFKTGEKEPAKKEAAVKAPSAEISEVIQNIKLVGISWSDDPDAMIEDIRIPRTFFVKRGAKIGDIKIQAIFKDKVIINYGGQEIELK